MVDSLTLPNVRTLRNILNTSVLDVMYYLSPTYGPEVCIVCVCLLSVCVFVSVCVCVYYVCMCMCVYVLYVYAHVCSCTYGYV